MTNNTTLKSKRRMAREPQVTAEAQPIEATGQQTEGPPSAIAVKKRPNKTDKAGPNKTDKVLELLRRAGGATLDELVEATGWLPHTTRAALTGLKKKGHTIERTKADGVSRYALVEANN